jgi:hypothetical protein
MASDLRILGVEAGGIRATFLPGWRLSADRT